MWVCTNGKKSTEIETSSIRGLLGIYSEENLINRSIFKKAIEDDLIEFKDLKNESSKILIPWQLFFLNTINLKKELEHINKTRLDKVSPKLIAKRKGAGNITSKRIIDRLIRLQNYICENNNTLHNPFCGSLVGKKDKEVIEHILSFFSIDLNTFRGYKNKATSLEYLIKKIESKNINISQGVLTNKMLPTWQVVENSVYKNTSGFVIKDDKIPFIFLPSEINPDETDGRQIYTLIYLLILIGLNEYNYFIERDFKTKAIKATGKQSMLYRLTSELLLPKEFTDTLKGEEITPEIRDDLSFKYKITPTAFLVTLRIRKIITKEEYINLLPPEYKKPKQKKNNMHAPGIETSVRKFCGKYSFDVINSAIKSGAIQSIHAQYLLFGGVNKKGYKKYREKLKI